jgi:hypothetical protein
MSGVLKFENLENLEIWGRKPGNLVGRLLVAGKVEKKGGNAFIMVSRFFQED